MKKRSLKKGILAGTIFTAALNFNACAYGPPDGGYGGVYTAPEESSIAETMPSESLEIEGSSTISSEQEEASEPAEPSRDVEFDPSQNFIAPVYGPPEAFQ
ncbi:MAG: hypothetical protein IJ794_15220 [Lachnospiraceae bacterium]|nr:hypothetical protein [Lachnospiraceae bacterium]